MNDKKPFGEMIIADNNGIAIYAKTYGQHELVKAIEKNDIIFVNGPSGTGKTYLACVMAAKYYKENRINSIILSRPAVESGEELGFLPGTISDKIGIFMRPLQEFMSNLLYKDIDTKNNNREDGNDFKRKNKKRGRRQNTIISEDSNIHLSNLNSCIRIEPLAYLRGITLENSFVLVDEAQNISKSQMKLLLTRIGKGSKFIINGDINQCDLDLKREMCGLEDAMKRLIGINKIGFVELTEKDIVRHDIIRDILRAYEIGRAE